MALLNEKSTNLRNRPDEWRIEQGLSGAALPFLDQTNDSCPEIEPRPARDALSLEELLEAVGDKTYAFDAEREGWKGYVRGHIFVIVCRSDIYAPSPFIFALPQPFLSTDCD